MNTALKRYDAMFIIPVLQGMWLLFGTLCGGIYYEEFLQMTRLQQGMFAVGVTILLLGVVIMSPKTVSGDIDEGSLLPSFPLPVSAAWASTIWYPRSPTSCCTTALLSVFLHVCSHALHSSLLFSLSASISPSLQRVTLAVAEQEDSAVVVVYQTLHSGTDSDEERHPLV